MSDIGTGKGVAPTNKFYYTWEDAAAVYIDRRVEIAKTAYSTIADVRREAQRRKDPQSISENLVMGAE